MESCSWSCTSTTQVSDGGHGGHGGHGGVYKHSFLEYIMQACAQNILEPITKYSVLTLVRNSPTGGALASLEPLVQSNVTLDWNWRTRLITDEAEMPDSVFAIDVDGDGDIDVLSSSALDNTVAWYENMAGDGREFFRHTITTEAMFAYRVFAIDLDADGDVDALSASVDDNTVAWYENIDGGGKHWTTHTITSSAKGANGLHATDVDGDGDVDVFATSGNDQAVVWFENMYVKTRDSGIPIRSHKQRLSANFQCTSPCSGTELARTGPDTSSA